jgi:hypothetical protein
LKQHFQQLSAFLRHFSASFCHDITPPCAGTRAIWTTKTNSRRQVGEASDDDSYSFVSEQLKEQKPLYLSCLESLLANGRIIGDGEHVEQATSHDADTMHMCTIPPDGACTTHELGFQEQT